MTEHTDIDRLLETWFADGPTAMPDRVVTVVADRIGRQGQRHTWLLDRRSKVNIFLKVALAAALGIAVIGGAIFLAGSRNSAPTPLPSPFPSASADASTPGATSVADALRSRWVAFDEGSEKLGTGSGPIDLTITASGSDLSVGNLGPAGSFASTVIEATDEQFRIALARDARACAAGSEGVYRWAMSGDGARVSLTAVSDDCPDRTIALERTWGRSLMGSTTQGAGIVDAFEPSFEIVLPDGSYGSRTLTDFIAIGSPDGHELMAWKNPQEFADPCAQPERYPYAPGADALVAYFRQNPAFNVIEATPLEIDGHHAIHLVTQAKADYAPCPGQELLLFTSKACDCHWIAGPSFRDSFYLVDVGEDTLALEWNPVDPTADEAIMRTLRIPAKLPGQ